MSETCQNISLGDLS